MENNENRPNRIRNIRIFSSVMGGLVIILYIFGFNKIANCGILFSLLGAAAYLYLSKDFTLFKQVIPYSKTVIPFTNRLFNFLKEAIISFIEVVISITKVILLTAIILSPIIIMLYPELAEYDIFKQNYTIYKENSVFVQILNESARGNAQIIEELHKIQYMIVTGITSATAILAVLIIRFRKPKNNFNNFNRK